MKKWIGLLLGALLLAGCGGPATIETVPIDEVTEVPVVLQQAEGKVVAEAIIEPARWSELRFDAAGKVTELLVQEGDVVEAGTPLVRLGTETLELTLEEAQTALQTAEVRLARAETEHKHQLAEAELALQTAEDRLAQARARFPSLTAAEVALQQAIQTEADAAHEYEKAEDRPWEWQHEEVQEAYTSAWQNAKDNLAIAQANYDAAHSEQYASSKELTILETDVQRAHLELEWLQERVDPLPAQDVENARLQVARAQVELEAATIAAPFAGTVTKVYVDAGDLVTSGNLILMLATLDRLQARTVDLMELDVARVAEGQAALVTVDALSGLKLKGHVASIDLQSVDYRDQVTYPVTVELDEAAPELRWGMTAVVEIEAQ